MYAKLLDGRVSDTLQFHLTLRLTVLLENPDQELKAWFEQLWEPLENRCPFIQESNAPSGSKQVTLNMRRLQYHLE